MSMEIELCPACRAGEPRRPIVSGTRYCAVCLTNPSAAWKRAFRRENGGRNELSDVDGERYRVWHREYSRRWRAARRGAPPAASRVHRNPTRQPSSPSLWRN